MSCTSLATTDEVYGEITEDTAWYDDNPAIPFTDAWYFPETICFYNASTTYVEQELRVLYVTAVASADLTIPAGVTAYLTGIFGPFLPEWMYTVNGDELLMVTATMNAAGRKSWYHEPWTPTPVGGSSSSASMITMSLAMSSGVPMISLSTPVQSTTAVTPSPTTSSSMPSSTARTSRTNSSIGTAVATSTSASESQTGAANLSTTSFSTVNTTSTQNPAPVSAVSDSNSHSSPLSSSTRRTLEIALPTTLLALLALILTTIFFLSRRRRRRAHHPTYENYTAPPFAILPSPNHDPEKPQPMFEMPAEAKPELASPDFRVGSPATTIREVHEVHGDAMVFQPYRPVSVVRSPAIPRPEVQQGDGWGQRETMRGLAEEAKESTERGRGGVEG